MIDNLRLLNPFAPIKTLDEARIAARVGAVGLFTQAAGSVFGGIMSLIDMDHLIAETRVAMETQAMPPESAAIAKAMVGPSMIYGVVGLSLFLAVVSLVLGLVQWRRLTKLIPLLFFLFSAYGSLSALRAFFESPGLMMGMSAWQGAIGWIVNLAGMVMLWTGFRGGDRLAKLRTAETLA